MHIWAVVVAGGSGNRFGRMKQFDLLGGRRVIDRSVDVVRAACAGVVVVVPSDTLNRFQLAGVTTVTGGLTRSESVRRGLAALPAEATHVLVHDAARPLASPSVVGGVIDALGGGAKGAIPVVAVTDSLRRQAGTSVDRAEFVAVQTPQGFELETLRAAHARGLDASDDASLLDGLGIGVTHTEGDSSNIKITVPHDLQIAEVLLDARQ